MTNLITNTKARLAKSCLIFLLSVVFSSCGGEIDNSKGDKIQLIEPYKEVFCKYTTKGVVEGNVLIHTIMFIDTCGKYKIGDVVCMGRKNY